MLVQLYGQYWNGSEWIYESWTDTTNVEMEDLVGKDPEYSDWTALKGRRLMVEWIAWGNYRFIVSQGKIYYNPRPDDKRENPL